MQPCDTAFHNQKRFPPTPVQACTPGPVAATVADRGPVLPIDHVALSSGRPDGLYVAGKQLRPWLTLEERLALRSWNANSKEHRAETARLTTMARQESLVVQWRIENGYAGTAEVLTTTIGEGDDRIERAAFTWGEQRHVHACKLGYELVERARGEMARAKMSPADIPEESYKRVHALVAALESEFVLPIGDVCRIFADVNLARAKAALATAKKVAKFWGVA